MNAHTIWSPDGILVQQITTAQITTHSDVHIKKKKIIIIIIILKQNKIIKLK